jgi:hypothetical protein
MEVQPDFRDLFAALNDAGVEYLVVGAHALAAHGHVRATKDLDVWIRSARANAERLMAALDAFGAPTSRVTAADFASPGTVYQIGVAPIRVDILTTIDGVTFDEAWPNRVPSRYGDQPIQVIARDDLLRNKRAAGRPQDLADVAALLAGNGES